MKLTRIHTNNAPAAIGPYSQAIVTGDFVFVTGQLGVDPATADLVSDDIREQTRRALENMRAVLEAAGTDLAHVVKTTVYLTEIADFTAMNEVYGGFFPLERPPARATVAVKDLPRGGLIEIEAVAVRKISRA